MFPDKKFEFCSRRPYCLAATVNEAYGKRAKVHAHVSLMKVGMVDQPIAALIGDLKRRGLLDDTLIVLGTDFRRTPGLDVMEGSNNREGRDHHPYAFSVLMADPGWQVRLGCYGALLTAGQLLAARESTSAETGD